MANLTDLPFEILELIASNLSKYAMKSFSLVSRKCRAVSEPHMFRTIEITYSEFDFTVLEELSRSPLAAYVKILHYDASELFDPVIQNWDYFTSCVYTPKEYAKDYTDFCWNLRGNSFAYKEIYAYFQGLIVDQQAIMEERKDIRAFTESLPRLIKLECIRLSFTGEQENQLLWFSNRLFIDSWNSFAIHFEAVLRGMTAAKWNGLTIQTLEIHGMPFRSTHESSSILEIAEQGLARVRNFKLVNSPGLLDLMSAVPLPCLQRFEITDCWLLGSKLISFLEAHGGNVQHVDFHRISLFYERFSPGPRSSDCASTFWEVVTETGNTVKVESLVIVPVKYH